MTDVLNVLYASTLLLLTALGLAIIFGLMGIINLAHGEFLMLGAYGALVTTTVTGSFWVALIVAPLLVAAVSAIVEVTIMRRLYQRPLETIVASWGLGIVLRQAMEILAGREFRNVQNPLPGAISLAGTDFPTYRVFVVCIVLILVAGLLLLQRRTRLGVLAQAVREKPDLAATVGIDTKRVYITTFAAGSALAALAGVLLAPTVNVFPGMGPPFVIGAFLVVLVAGVGSVLAVVAAALVLGLTQTVLADVYSPVAGSLGLLVIAVIAMRLLPQGLSGLSAPVLRKQRVAS